MSGKEVWRDVPSKPGLEASSLGRVRRKQFSRSMPKGGDRVYQSAPTFGVIGRAKAGAMHTYRTYHYRGIGNVKVHRLVCEAFLVPPPFPGAVCIHVDEDAHNNVPSNLKWGTQKENLNAPGFLCYCEARKIVRSA